MSRSAKAGFALPLTTAAGGPFAAVWDAPVPALKPIGAARVIHSWEAPNDLWRTKPAGGVASPAAPDRTTRGH